MENGRDVVITGIGLVSSLGEGIEAHLRAFAEGGAPTLDSGSYAPYTVHPLPQIDWTQQISKRGDLRQMETWQRLGTYAAGLALSDAGIEADEGVRAHIDMIVAAGGGERDMTVDALVMERVRKANDRERVVNETLSSELRPTLFLAQLSNLLAGNISIVHKVTGSSRTFMGEEAAGISALAAARARIASGQSETCLVGGAFSAERKDLILNFDLAGLMLRSDWKPVTARQAPDDGIAIGSVGAFLILESAEGARKRGVKPYARLTSVSGDRGKRTPEATHRRLSDLLPADVQHDKTLVLSGATGIETLTSTERKVLDERFPDVPRRAYGTLIGHSFEAHVPAGVALAAGLLAHRTESQPLDAANEGAVTGAPDRILVTTVGHLHAEGVCVVDGVADPRS